MKAYIALSRVRRANDILIAGVVSPALFRMGAHPWPTALLQVLRGEKQRPDTVQCKELTKANDKAGKIEDLTFYCSSCKLPRRRDYFVQMPLARSKDPEWYDAVFDEILAPGNTRSCQGKDSAKEADVQSVTAETSSWKFVCQICGTGSNSNADFEQAQRRNKGRNMSRNSFRLSLIHI